MEVHKAKVLELAFLHGHLGNPGTAQVGEVRVPDSSDALEARLVEIEEGTFKIEPLTASRQRYDRSDKGRTSWEWRVTPLKPGDHQKLHLTLESILSDRGTEDRRTIGSLDREIQVTPDPKPTVFTYSLVAGVLGAGGLLLARGRRRRQHPQLIKKLDPSTDKPYVFVSYARRDQGRVLPVVQSLQDQSVLTWLDLQGVEGATLWSSEIVEAIRNAKVFVLFASKSAFASDFVIREVLLAAEEHRPILPIYIEEVAVPAQIRLQLVGIQHILLRDGAEARDMDLILSALSKLGVGPGPSQGRAKVVE